MSFTHRSMKPFDLKLLYTPHRLRLSPTIVVIGQSDADKTTIAVDIIREQKNASVGVYVAGTEECALALKSIVPQEHIHREYTGKLVKTMFRRQIHGAKLSEVECKNCTLLLHDCLPDKWFDHNILRQACMNGRHWRMSVIITMPVPQSIPPMMRVNIDYTFILPESDPNKRLLLYEYAQMFDTFDAFCEVLDCASQDGGCLVVDNRWNNMYTHKINQSTSIQS